MPLIHGTGCCIKSNGEGYANLQRMLNGYANFAATLIVGLGCEVMQISRLMDECSLEESPNFRRLVIQEEGGTRKTVEAGVAIIESMLSTANVAMYRYRN